MPLYSSEHVENLAKVEAVVSLLHATGVHRLFTKEDFSEFFERLHLITLRYNMIDNFFLNKNLMFIIFRGEIFKLEFSDVIDCIGLMGGPSPRKMEEKASWMKNIQQFINDTILEGLENKQIIFIKDIEVNNIENNPIVTEEIVFKNKMKNVTSLDFENAKILAKSMTSEMPDSIFSEWLKRYPNAIKDYDDKLELIKSIPVFHFLKLSNKQREQVKAHFEQFQEEPKIDFLKMRNLTHLAWAWANGFVFRDERGEYHLEDFIWLDGNLIQLDGGGYNFEESKDMYLLEDLFDVLKIHQ